MYLTVFISSIGFTIVLPSLFFYIEKELLEGDGMSESSKQQFLSYVVAIYSVGQFVGSLVFGFWSNRRRTAEPLVVSLLILLVSNIYYGLAQDFPRGSGFPRQWHVFIARFFVGFGAGNVALARAFVSEASTLETRSMAMTITGAAQGVGFVIGPAIGFAFTLMPTTLHIGPIFVNGYTMAGFASAFFTLINIVLIPLLFRDIPHKAAQGKDRIRAPPMTRSELFAMVSVMWIFFVILSSFSIFETITGPMMQDYFGWGSTRNGILIFAAGGFSVLVFLGLGIVTKKAKVDDRWLIAFGVACLLASNLFMTPYWGSSGLGIWQIYIGSVWVGLGYPVASAITYALFSKVIHPVAQGDKMGYLTAVGSLARMLGPIWATALYMSSLPVPRCLEPVNGTDVNHGGLLNLTASCFSPGSVIGGGEATHLGHGYTFGVRGYPGAWMFMTMGALLLITLMCMAIAWRRLTPHPEAGNLSIIAESIEETGHDSQSLIN